MKNSMYHAGMVAILLSSIAGSALAIANSDKEAIRNLSNQGAADFQNEQFEPARDKFQRAYEIAKVPRLAVWLARANEKLGKLVTAYELYREALTLEPNELWKADLQQQAQKDAQSELDQLQPRIPKLTITVAGAPTDEVSVTIDGVAVPSGLLGVERLVDPNQRQIVGQHGSEVVTETVQLTEGARQEVVLRFVAAAAKPTPAVSPIGVSAAEQPSSTFKAVSPAPAVSRRNTLHSVGWIGVGVGAAGVVLGTTTGILVAVKHGDLSDKCPTGTCYKNEASELQSYRTLRTFSTVSFVVGGIAGAAGATLLLLNPKQEGQPAIGLCLSPGAVDLRGAF